MGFNETLYRKVYIGDKTGKAQLLYGPRSAHRKTVTPLSVARSSLAATTIGDYALFGGGSGKDTVDAFYMG